MDDLNDLMLFAAVVSHGSFSRASQALGVTKSLVSRRVAALEHQLGVRLLHRSTRAVIPTETGISVAVHCESMLEASRAAFSVARDAKEKPAGRLRVSCPPGVGSFFLEPMLIRFMESFPDIRMDFELSNRQVDVIGEGFDIAFRVRSKITDSNLTVRNFGACHQVLVASPEFLGQYGEFESLESLYGIRAAGRRTSGRAPSIWKFVEADGAPVNVPYTPIFQTDDVYLLTQLAMSGAVVAQIPFNVCEHQIASGQLRLLVPTIRMQAPTLFAVMPARRLMTAAVREFLNFSTLHLTSEVDRIGQQLSAIRAVARPTPPRPG